MKGSYKCIPFNVYAIMLVYDNRMKGSYKWMQLLLMAQRLVYDNRMKGELQGQIRLNPM